MPTNSSEGDIVYEKKNLRLKYVLEKNPENLSERSAVGKSIAGKEKTGSKNFGRSKIKSYYACIANLFHRKGFTGYAAADRICKTAA